MRPDRSTETVLDASVVIAAQNPAEPQHDRALSILDEVAASVWILHPLTLTELLVLPAARGGAEAVTAYESWIAGFGATVLESPQGSGFANEESCREIALLRARTRLKLPDVVVVHCASTRGAGLATLDDRMAAAARELGVEVIDVPR